MKLWIAEKPQLAKVIAEELGVVRSHNGFIECGNNNIVTWCFGHMIQSKDAKEYNSLYESWSLENLPMKLYPLQYKPIEDKKTQLNIIGSLLKKASEVVNSGDVDDEGQLLIDEILEYFKWNTWGNQTKRVLIADMSAKAVKKSISNLRPNLDFKGQYLKALARTSGDFIFGLNMTRFITINAQKNGYRQLISIGRVQTPILGLVVNRYLAWKNHEEQFFYEIKASTDGFDANLIPPQDVAVDEKNRMINQDELNSLIQEKLIGNKFEIFDKKNSTKKEYAPLPFSLASLQQLMNKEHGMTAHRTLEITQSLREKHKAITYNRSDCTYLSEAQYEESGELLSKILNSGNYDNFKENDYFDESIKPRCFNDSKITAHTAIIPTLETPDFGSLTSEELNVYKAIVERYLLQFAKPKIIEQVEMKLKHEEYIFKTGANKVIELGHESIMKDCNEDDITHDDSKSYDEIQKLNNEDVIEFNSIELLAKKTSRPTLFTEASLISALVRIADYVEDIEIKKILKEKDKDNPHEHGSIGTSATRSFIIENLKSIGLIGVVKNSVIPSETAIKLIGSLPSKIVNPDLTALWFEQQKEIGNGEKSIDSFIDDLYSQIHSLFNSTYQSLDFSELVDKLDCPICASQFHIHPKLGYCSNEDCGMKIWRSVASKNLSDNQIRELVIKGKTKEISGFVSKSEKKFSAVLLLNKTEKKIDFHFPDKKKSNKKTIRKAVKK